MIEHLVEPDTVFGGNGENRVDAELVELIDKMLILVRVDLVNRQKQGFIQLAQHLREFTIGGSDF